MQRLRGSSRRTPRFINATRLTLETSHVHRFAWLEPSPSRFPLAICLLYLLEFTGLTHTWVYISGRSVVVRREISRHDRGCEWSSTIGNEETRVRPLQIKPDLRSVSNESLSGSSAGCDCIRRVTFRRSTGTTEYVNFRRAEP